MYKFFVNSNQIKNNKVVINGEDYNHIKNVIRLTKEELIYICNKEFSETFKCKIKNMENNEINCEIIEKVLETTETKTNIHIFQGLPKSDKFEFIIEKCTEIGVKEITPILMKRTIVKLDEKDMVKKLIRWNKIAETASKQSKRDSILKVNNIIKFNDILNKLLNYDMVLVAYEEEKNNLLKNILKKQSLKNKINNIAVIIGPEGGIDYDEIELCKNNNVIPITLGKRILRTETAPIVAASNILYELED